jgi:endogenous inhibitor of DNA gyrase (YacG/DUF329 family)
VTEAGDERMVPCPSCGAHAVFGASNRWRPFCSKRCRLTDLGAWATESYRIPAREEDESGAADDTEP